MQLTFLIIGIILTAAIIFVIWVIFNLLSLIIIPLVSNILKEQKEKQFSIFPTVFQVQPVQQKFLFSRTVNLLNTALTMS